MWIEILRRIKEKREREDRRIPLRIYDEPHEDLDADINKGKNDKSNNNHSDNVINVDEEFNIDFNINEMKLK